MALETEALTELTALATEAVEVLVGATVELALATAELTALETEADTELT